jgi:RNA polymerase sigma-70 factor (ECF subfamily)
LISAWRNLPNFRGDAGLRAWVLGIARHKVEDYYRKRIREAESEDEDTDTREPTIISQIQERLEAAADHERVHRTLTQLPEVYGLALIWRYRDEKSLREMAQLTGKTEKAMERLLARARESFRKRWNDDQP